MFRRVLPLAKAFVAVTPDSPRALPAAELAAWLAQFSIPVSVQETLDQGVDTALALAGPEDVICAWGSLYSVGEIPPPSGAVLTPPPFSQRPYTE